MKNFLVETGEDEESAYIEPDGENTISAQDYKTIQEKFAEGGKAVLESAGATWEDLVDVTVFLTDIKRDFATYNRIYAEYFSAETGPCRTTVEVNRLPTPIAIELKCIALARRS